MNKENLAWDILYKKATPSRTTRATIAQAGEGVPNNIIIDVKTNSILNNENANLQRIATKKYKNLLLICDI